MGLPLSGDVPLADGCDDPDVGPGLVAPASFFVASPVPVPVPGGDAVVLAERGGSGALEAEVAGGALAGTRNPDADADGSGATVAEGGVGSCARCRARSTSAPTVSTTPAAPRIPMPAAIKRVARERGGGGVARDDGGSGIVDA